VNEADQPTALSYSQHDLDGHIWSFSELAAEDDRAISDLATGLTSLGFIRAALRRQVRVWCGAALVGLVIGLGVFQMFPPAFQASAAVLLGNNPFEVPGSAAQDDQAIIQSRAVAAAALHRLGITEDPGSFIPDYTVIPVTDRVLTITVKATSYVTAIREANALAAAFLVFQTQQLEAQERLVTASMQEQVAQAQRHAVLLGQRVTAQAAQAASPAQRTELAKLTNEHDQAVEALQQLKQANLNNQANTKIETTTLIKGTQVLDAAAPLPQHTKRYLVLYAGAGLLGGLVLGLFIVIIRALVSDRLRRRDDIARALGAPVRLSVGRVRPRRWRPGPTGLEAARSASIERVVKHLDRTIAASPAGPATLAVLPTDKPDAAALAVVSLALSHARRGLSVVVADLCPGSPAARLLHVGEPGVESVTVADAELVVAVPDRHETAPAGPLARPHRRQNNQEPEPLAAACAKADVLLTLMTLDPAVGAEHLRGWARHAVAVVTAGGSTAVRIQAVGEMTRLSGTELVGAVLVGADTADESLGAFAAPPTAVTPSLR
jgi:capsular polysaccharide biosynthesis protein